MKRSTGIPAAVFIDNLSTAGRTKHDKGIAAWCDCHGYMPCSALPMTPLAYQEPIERTEPVDPQWSPSQHVRSTQ